MGDPYAWKEEKNIWKGVVKEWGGLFGTNILSVRQRSHIPLEMQISAAIAGSDTLERILPGKQVFMG